MKRAKCACELCGRELPVAAKASEVCDACHRSEGVDMAAVAEQIGRGKRRRGFRVSDEWRRMDLDELLMRQLIGID